jgi:hypothetical protein
MTYPDAWGYNGLVLADPEESDAEIRYRLMDRSNHAVATLALDLDMNGIPAACQYYGNAQLARSIYNYLYAREQSQNVCPYCYAESWDDEHNCCRACSCQ